MLLFLVTPCLAVAVQPYMEWTPIKKKCVSFGELAGKKGPKTPNHEQGHFERNLSLQFHDLHSMRSHPYIKIIWRWNYTCFSIFEVLQQFGKIGYQCPDFYRLLILIFSTFRAFNYYSTMRSMNYFGQVFLEILENN